MRWFVSYGLYEEAMKAFVELHREHNETCLKLGKAEGEAAAFREIAEHENDRNHKLLKQLVELKKQGFEPQPEGVDYGELEPAMPKELGDAILERCESGSSTFHQLTAWVLDQMRLGTGTKDIVDLLLQGSDEAI